LRIALLAKRSRLKQHAAGGSRAAKEPY